MDFKEIRQDFMDDVYKVLDFLESNDVANTIIDSFDNAIDDSVPIPKNVTNGDMEKIMHPDVNYCLSSDGKVINAWYSEDGYYVIPLDWWNKPYSKKEEA